MPHLKVQAGLNMIKFIQKGYLMSFKIISVIGARPQFIKAAVLSNALNKIKSHNIEEILIHTGQHYDTEMNELFFDQLGLKKPDYFLNAGTYKGIKQLSFIMDEIEPILRKESPHALLLYGDTNSTLAAAIVSTQLDIPIIHMEAGERVYRREKVPEESNRIITDHLAALNLTATKKAEKFLLREGIYPKRIAFVGDLMYDLFLQSQKKLLQSQPDILNSLNLSSGDYHLATLHRAENTSDTDFLFLFLETLDQSQKTVIFPVHPRVEKLLQEHAYVPHTSLRFIKPQGYYAFITLLLHCDKVITDSGGVTKEAYFAQKPSIIPMYNTWWTEISESGWSLSVGKETDALAHAIDHFSPSKKSYSTAFFGEGNAAQKSVEKILSFLKRETKTPWHPYGSIETLPLVESSDFTYSNYLSLLRQLKDNHYSFEAFSNIDNVKEKKQPYLFLRHDIDMDLNKALEMAKIEHQEEVTSTYFVMLRNDFYSLFSHKNTQLINEILSLNHRIGLHFDFTCYDPSLSIEEINTFCLKEVNQLKQWFNTRIDAVSFHRPDKTRLNSTQNLTSPYRHTYEKSFITDAHYFSDSTGKWRFGHPLQSEAFKEKKPLHLLIHPIWWNKEAKFSYHTLMDFIDRQKRRNEIALTQNSKQFTL